MIKELNYIILQNANLKDEKINSLLEDKLNYKAKKKIKILAFKLIQSFNSKNRDYLKVSENNVSASYEIAKKFYEDYTYYLTEILKIIKDSIPEITEETIFNDETFYNKLIPNFDNRIENLKNIINIVKKNREFLKTKQKISKKLQKDCKNLYLTKQMTPYIKIYENDFINIQKKNEQEIKNLEKDFKDFETIFQNYINYYNSLTNILQILVSSFFQNSSNKEEYEILIKFYKNILTNNNFFSENLYEDFEKQLEVFFNFFKKCSIAEKRQFLRKTIKNRAESRAFSFVFENSENKNYDYIKNLLKKQEFEKEEHQDIIIALLNYNKQQFKEEVEIYKQLFNSINNDFCEIEGAKEQKTILTKEENLKEKENLKKLFLEKLKQWKEDEFFANERTEYEEYLYSLNDFMVPKNKKDADENFINITLNDKTTEKEETITVPKQVNISDFHEKMLKVLYLLNKKHLFPSSFFFKFKNYAIYKKNYFKNFYNDVLDLYIKKIKLTHKKFIKQIDAIVGYYDEMYTTKDDSSNEKHIRKFKNCFGLNGLKENQVNETKIAQFKNIKEYMKSDFKEFLDDFFYDYGIYIKTNDKEKKEFLMEKFKVKKEYLEFLKNILNIELFHHYILEKVIENKLQKQQVNKIISQVYNGTVE